MRKCLTALFCMLLICLVPLCAAGEAFDDVDFENMTDEEFAAFMDAAGFEEDDEEGDFAGFGDEDGDFAGFDDEEGDPNEYELDEEDLAFIEAYEAAHDGAVSEDEFADFADSEAADDTDGSFVGTDEARKPGVSRVLLIVVACLGGGFVVLVLVNRLRRRARRKRRKAAQRRGNAPARRPAPKGSTVRRTNAAGRRPR